MNKRIEKIRKLLEIKPISREENIDLLSGRREMKRSFGKNESTTYVKNMFGPPNRKI